MLRKYYKVVLLCVFAGVIGIACADALFLSGFFSTANTVDALPHTTGWGF